MIREQDKPDPFTHPDFQGSSTPIVKIVGGDKLEPGDYLLVYDKNHLPRKMVENFCEGLARRGIRLHALCYYPSVGPPPRLIRIEKPERGVPE